MFVRINAFSVGTFYIVHKSVYNIFIPTHMRMYRLKYAIATAHTLDTFWKQQSLMVKRTWSKLLLESNNDVVSLIEGQKNCR